MAAENMVGNSEVLVLDGVSSCRCQAEQAWGGSLLLPFLQSGRLSMLSAAHTAVHGHVLLPPSFVHITACLSGGWVRVSLQLCPDALRLGCLLLLLAC